MVIGAQLLDEDVSFELVRHKGKLTPTAKALGVCSSYVRQRIRENPSVMDAYLHARDEIVDSAEQVMMDKLKEGSERAAMYILSTLGKDRGYTERHEITGKDGAELVVTLNLSNTTINMNEDTEESTEGEPDYGGNITRLA
jgi:hypothetical protein